MRTSKVEVSKRVAELLKSLPKKIAVVKCQKDYDELAEEVKTVKVDAHELIVIIDPKSWEYLLVIGDSRVGVKAVAGGFSREIYAGGNSQVTIEQGVSYLETFDCSSVVVEKISHINVEAKNCSHVTAEVEKVSNGFEARFSATDSATLDITSKAPATRWGGTSVVCYADSFVRVHGSAHIESHDHSKVEAHDDCVCSAFDRSSVVANDRCKVLAQETSSFNVLDECELTANDNSCGTVQSCKTATFRNQATATLSHRYVSTFSDNTHSPHPVIVRDYAKVTAISPGFEIKAIGHSEVKVRYGTVVAMQHARVKVEGQSTVTLLHNSIAELKYSKREIQYAERVIVQARHNSQVELEYGLSDYENTRNVVSLSDNARIVNQPSPGQEFCCSNDFTEIDGKAKLYKSVFKKDGKYLSILHPEFEYKIGEEIEADSIDTSRHQDCSNGLHVASLTWAINFGKDQYRSGLSGHHATPFDGKWGDYIAILECEVVVDDLVVPFRTGGKARVKKLFVTREVPKEEWPDNYKE